MRLVQCDLSLQKRIAGPLRLEGIDLAMGTYSFCKSDRVRADIGAYLDNMVAGLDDARQEGRLVGAVLAVQGERLTDIDIIEIDQKIAVAPGNQHQIVVQNK